MLEKLFYENILIYVMVAMFGLGMLLKLLLYIGYSRMIRASNNMGRTNNKLFKKLKVKSETFYKLKINVNNVDAFVDKSINNHKIGGILLITWEKISGQVSIICGMTGLAGALLGDLIGIERMWIVRVLAVGLVISGLLMVFENLLNKDSRKEIIKVNAVDYLENYLINRLEQESKNPELISELEGMDLIDKTPTLKDKWLKLSENYKRRREEKKATRLFKKQTRQAARAKRKEDRKKEAEMKEALKLEKQLSNQNKKAKKATVTTAQQNKESLKKEIGKLHGGETDQEAAITLESAQREKEKPIQAKDTSMEEKTKKSIQLTKEDEEIIKDILKEYLS